MIVIIAARFGWSTRPAAHCAENEATDPMLDGLFTSANLEDLHRAQSARGGLPGGL
jgi:hypothetical protein